MSIAEDLANALRQWGKEFNPAPDLIVIILGGGTTNDYDLATLLYEHSVSILVGIGTEKNQIILNKLTNHSFSSPSKLISGICNLIIERI